MVGYAGTACQRRRIGTSPTTAMVSACSSSATAGPTKVTPSSTSRSVSTTAIAAPSQSSANSDEPATDSGICTTLCGRPAVAASAAVRPTLATCGVVNTTDGVAAASAVATNGD